MSKYIILFTLFKRFILAEYLYIFATFVISVSITFIFIVLFLGKDLYTHYSHIESALLPKSIAITDDNLTSVNKKLLEYPKYSNSLRGELLNIPQASFSTSRNSSELLAKDYSLFAFDFHVDETMDLRCGTKKITPKILDITSIKKGEWIIKSESFDCDGKKLQLKISDNSVDLYIKRKTKRYVKLLYKTDIKADKYFYPYLIKICKDNFFDYYPISKYYVTNNKLTPDTQKHSKMLKSIFSIIFAGNKKRVVANSSVYDYLSTFKKTSFNISVQHSKIKSKMVVLDKFPFPVDNKSEFYSNILLANLSSFKELKFDKRFVMFNSADVDKDIFSNAKWIDKNELLVELEKFNTSINIGLSVMTFLLVVFLISFTNSFVRRIYSAYENLLRELIFYGLEFRILTLIIGLILFLASLVAIYISTELFNNINNIFNIYYIDLIEFDVNKFYLFIFIMVAMVFTYKTEKKLQIDNIKNYKGK